MSLLDYHIAKTVVAQMDATKPTEENFKAAPDQVYQKRAPNNMLPNIKEKNYEDQTQLDKVNPDLTTTGEVIAIAAKELREFEEQLKAERDILRDAQDLKKEQFNYMQKMRELETSVQYLGNAILSTQEQAGITSRKLFRLQEHWLYVQRESKSQQVKPNELQVLMQVLEQNLSPMIVQKMLAEKDALMQKLTVIKTSITKTLQVSPIKEDHTNNAGPRVSILHAQLQDDLNVQIMQLVEGFNSFTYELSTIDSELDQVIPNNVTQLSDVSAPTAMPLAANRDVQ